MTPRDLRAVIGALKLFQLDSPLRQRYLQSVVLTAAARLSDPRCAAGHRVTAVTAALGTTIDSRASPTLAARAVHRVAVGTVLWVSVSEGLMVKTTSEHQLSLFDDLL